MDHTDKQALSKRIDYTKAELLEMKSELTSYNPEGVDAYCEALDRITDADLQKFYASDVYGQYEAYANLRMENNERFCASFNWEVTLAEVDKQLFRDVTVVSNIDVALVVLGTLYLRLKHFYFPRIVAFHARPWLAWDLRADEYKRVTDQYKA